MRDVRFVIIAAIAFLLLTAKFGLSQEDTEQIDLPVLKSQSFRVPDDLL